MPAPLAETPVKPRPCGVWPVMAAAKNREIHSLIRDFSGNEPQDLTLRFPIERQLGREEFLSGQPGRLATLKDRLLDIGREEGQAPELADIGIRMRLGLGQILQGCQRRGVELGLPVMTRFKRLDQLGVLM